MMLRSRNELNLEVVLHKYELTVWADADDSEAQTYTGKKLRGIE